MTPLRASASLAPALIALGLFGLSARAQDPNGVEAPAQAIVSRVLRTEVGERILIQEVWVEAPVEDVWRAYTTEEGWTAWAVPSAKVDLRVGGTILTAYGDVEIGEQGTNTLNIVNYVPLELLTLRADLSENWPEVLQEDAERLSNVILFEDVSANQTRIRSFGIGYGDSPEYEGLMQFFIQGNEALFGNLKRYLESGERQDWSR